MPTEPKKDEVQVVVIVDNHTHAGKPCKKGDTLTVTRATAEWMAANGVIDKPAGK